MLLVLKTRLEAEITILMTLYSASALQIPLLQVCQLEQHINIK